MVAEDAERLWQKLRLSNTEHERLASMAEGWRRISPRFGEHAARVLLYRLGPEQFTDHALLGWTRSEQSAHDADWHALATLPQRWTAPVFPLKAADFIARGVEKGPALGAAMRAAEAAWIAAEFPGEPAAIAAHCRCRGKIAAGVTLCCAWTRLPPANGGRNHARVLARACDLSARRHSRHRVRRRARVFLFPLCFPAAAGGRAIERSRPRDARRQRRLHPRQAVRPDSTTARAK